MRSCGCSLCLVYAKVERKRTTDLLRGAKNFFAKFRRPRSETKTAAAREWIAMVFWCTHPSTMGAWDTLHRRKRDFVASCLRTPSAWNRTMKLSFAKTAVLQMWQETAQIMAHSAKDSGRAILSKSPTRAARRQQFLAKIKSLIFNPVEWLDQAEQSTLIKARKIATSLAGTGAGGEAVSTSFAIPYASSSWGQSLTWPPT